MRDPFAQALDHRYALERLIDDIPGWRGRDLFIVHTVALPDIPVHSLALAPDAPPEPIIDHRGLEHIDAALERALVYHRGARERRRPPGPDGVAMLRDLLAPTLAIEAPLAAAFLDEERALITLTRDQALLLARMARNPRMAIYGCAGSGKTVLGGQWDALLVDEAQDLHDHWLAALRYSLRDEPHAPVWLFLDDNQRVYEADFTVPGDFFRWELGTNCRTTQAIHRQLLRLYDSEIVPDARGPEGRDPELYHADNRAETVDALLNRLLGPDDVAPQDVVVLSSHARERSAVAQALGRRFARRPGQTARTRSPVLLDPWFQGPRSAGRSAVRARGHQHRHANAAALRRDVTAAQPLRDRRATRSVTHSNCYLRAFL